MKSTFDFGTNSQEKPEVFDYVYVTTHQGIYKQYDIEDDRIVLTLNINYKLQTLLLWPNGKITNIKDCHGWPNYKYIKYPHEITMKFKN